MFVVSLGGNAAAALQRVRQRAERVARLVAKACVEAKGKPYLVETDKAVIVGNRYMGAAFDRDTLELAALVDVAHGANLLAVGGGHLWQVALGRVTDDRKAKPVTVTSAAAADRSYTIERTDGGVSLHLKWAKVSSSEEKNTLAARARIVANAGSRHLKWRIDVDCASTGRGLHHVDFPMLSSIVPMGDAQKTALFAPTSTGEVIGNPFASGKKYPADHTGRKGHTMQYSAVYGPAGGLFLGAQDGRARTKTFHHEFDRKTETLTYYLRNVPENRDAVGVDYRMPYDFVATTFKGDWFTAAKIYRQWAIKQIWCSEGPLHRRKSTPDWFKNLAYWMIAWEQKGIGGGKEYEKVIKPKIGPDKDQTLADIDTIATRIGLPTAVHFYGWHHNNFDRDVPEYFPARIGDKAFRRQVQAIHGMGAGTRVMPYINGRCWNDKTPSYKEQNVVKHVVKNRQGKPHKQGAYGDWMCSHTPFWQDTLVKMSERLVRDYGADGVYYDQVSFAAQNCFDPDHGHPVGVNMFDGERTALVKCRDAIRKINPDAILTGEMVSESLMDCLDGILLSVDQIPAGTVPAFQAVYNDYFILFGNMNLNYDEPVKVTPMVVGESFTAGDQLGWFNTWPIFTPGHPRNMGVYWKDPKATRRVADFTVHIVRLRYHAGRKFLVYGEMLKPLAFTNPLAHVKGWWQKFRKVEIRSLPAVMHSVWKAPDGSLGIVLCNITHDEHVVKFRLDLRDYGMPEAQTYVLVERASHAVETTVATYRTRSFDTSVTMPPLRGRILELRAQ